MNIQEFRSHLKTQCFNALNETYNNLYINRYRWSEEQHRIVIRYVNFEIDNFINENRDKFPINNTQSETMSSRFVDMLMNFIFDDENINTPENMVELLQLQLQGRGKKKSNKSKKLKKLKKLKKSKKSKKSKK
jgi:hypothetical protein